MKKIINNLFLIFLLFCSNGVFAQNVSQGFRYQAIAKDASGNIIENQEIQIRIQLTDGVNSNEVFYEEIHTARTDKSGIINTIIGRGNTRLGSFEEIPWSNEMVWINISMDFNNEGNFDESHYAQLLAVPYAMYAFEAAELSDDNTRGNIDEPVDAKYWQVEGNQITEKIGNKLGSTNDVDIVFITSDIERARISADGDLSIQNNTSIGQTLTVQDVATFMSSVTIKGDAEVTGNITGQSNAYFYQDLFVQLNALIEGNLNVTGNTELFGDLDVIKGNTTLNQNLEVKGLSLFSNETNSLSKDDGSIVIEGGVGLEKNLNMGGNLTQDDMDDEVIIGKTTIINETQSLDKDSGALIVEGGVGIEKDVWIGGDLNVVGDLKGSGLVIDGKRNGPDDQWDSYPVQITGINQGIAVRTLESPDSDNNFITFFDENDEPVGRIEGQTKSDILDSEEWQIETAFLSAAVASSIGSIAADVTGELDMVVQLTEVVADAVNHVVSLVGAICGAIGASAGVGDAICIAIVMVIDLAYTAIQHFTMLSANFVELTINGFDLLTNIANLIQYEVLVFENAGSTFQSGSADYAEWLPTANQIETFNAGDVVAVIGGQITKNTENAEQYMVVSSDPIMLGNMPKKDDQRNYEMVAFMGQVPVKVYGQVNSGDYLIASDSNNGFAKPVNPRDLTLDDCKKIVGISWGASNNTGINYVNASIGLNKNDVIPIIENQVREIEDLRNELNKVKAYIVESDHVLSKLVPGYQEEIQQSKYFDSPEYVLTNSSELIEDKSMAMINSSLSNIIDGFVTNRRDNSSYPMNNAALISKVNTINPSNPFGTLNSGNSMSNIDIESFITDILDRDFIQEFRDQIPALVQDAVDAVLDEIFVVRDEIVNEIASQANFTQQERDKLEDKINEIVPLFGVLDDEASTMVSDAVAEINALFDEVLCEVCSVANSLPITISDINNLDIPPQFFFDVINFFDNTYGSIRNLEIGFNFPNPPGGSISVSPFEDIMPNISSSDIPFLGNSGISLTFPDPCANLQCN